MDELDLPLLSNIESVRARHYLIQLISDVENQIIHGTVIIFFGVPSACELKGEYCTGKCSCGFVNSTSESEMLTFPITLECNNLNIRNVSEVKPKIGQSIQEYLSANHVKKDAENFAAWNDNIKVPLSFTQDEWSVRIQIADQFQDKEFPKVICIDYLTCPEGDSLYWRKPDGGDVCFFTAGSYINNRSLIPSQDRPFAMATWQAWIIVPEEFYVSMTGDEEPVLSSFTSNFSNPDGSIIVKTSSCFYYYTAMVLPMATIAIAVGKWKKDVLLSKEEIDRYNRSHNNSSSSLTGHNTCNHMTYPCHMTLKSNIIGPLIAVTFVTSENNLSSTKRVLQFVKYILISSFKLLGIHPFKRLEIVIMPRCFPHLGLASPNLLFLSKSIVVDDSSFYLRLAHEISHSWFGITIGPKNWEEEWLSEGVATYLEDSIFALALEASKGNGEGYELLHLADVVEKYSEFFSLRGHLRYKMLLNERENSDEELQILCPEGLSPSLGQGSVNNGLNVNKSFLQVHYLTGYFLLHHLSIMVSRQAFDAFFGMVAVRCHGQLISSLEFLRLFFNHFPELDAGDNPELRIFNTWLKNSDINSEIVDSFSCLTDNKLMKSVNDHYCYWVLYDESLKTRKSFPDLEIQMNSLKNHKLVYSDQVVLLFEHLLQVKRLKIQTLKSIHEFYDVKCQNPEVQHRWCELVIKFKYPEMDDVTAFLIENQSMGVYLYGELMISGEKKHAKLAKDTFLFLKQELSTSSKAVISSMVFGE